MDPTINNTALVAAIRTFYNDGHDVIHAIASAILVIMNEPEDGITNIKVTFIKRYSMPITDSPLMTAIKRLRKEGLVDYKNFEKIAFTDKGHKEVARLKLSIGDIGREFQQLANDLKKFCRDHKLKVPEDSTLEKELLQFIDENIGITSLLVSDTKGVKALPKSVIAEYIVYVEKSNATLFTMLQNLFFGRLYLSMLQTRTDYMKLTSFEPLKTYLDTNILLGALGLKNEQDNRQAQELISVISSAKNIKLAVLDITVDEARRVLSAYNQNKGNYIENIKVNSTYHRLNTINIDKYELKLLLENIEDKITAQGIIIESALLADQASDTRYNYLYGEISTWAGILDRPKNEKALVHDASALRFVEMERNKVQTQLLEKAKAIFVTPDLSIKSVVFEDVSQSKNVPLAYTPIELVSYLWFRDVGDKEIATSVVRQSVMAYARERLISHNLWEKFMEELQNAEKQSKLTIEDIGFILASDETERMLAKEKTQAIKKIINPTNVRHLRYKQEQLANKSEESSIVIQQAYARIEKFSYFIAHALFIFIALILLAFITSCLVKILKHFGLGAVSSSLSVAGVFTLLVVSLIMGRKLDFFGTLIKIRSRVISKIYIALTMTAKSLIFGKRIKR